MGALAEMYVQGVSTRKVKAITEELCGHSFSASSISAINQRLDDGLAQFAPGGGIFRPPRSCWSGGSFPPCWNVSPTSTVSAFSALSDSAIRSHVSARARHSSADMGMMAYRASAR